MAPASVQTCVTSPPYFGLRNYGHDAQIGQEATPGEFVDAMVEVFREVRRVLADDGTVFLNLGDSYCTAAKGNPRVRGNINGGKRDTVDADIGSTFNKSKLPGIKNKDLIGIPWLVAFALRADGWYLRQDIIWAKPNPMPESVRDRCTKSHEYIFLLSKSQKYFFDADAIAEPAECGKLRGSGPMVKSGTGRDDVNQRGDYRLRRSAKKGELKGKTKDQSNPAFRAIVDMRNKRDVWTVATRSFPEAHFATFPPELIEPCILAGSRKGDVVLDPFGGAGTTGLVADQNGRSAVLIELNPEYAEMARTRIRKDGGMFATVEVDL